MTNVFRSVKFIGTHKRKKISSIPLCMYHMKIDLLKLKIKLKKPFYILKTKVLYKYEVPNELIM